MQSIYSKKERTSGGISYYSLGEQQPSPRVYGTFGSDPL